MTARRAERHHEFVAHDLKVNCARLGRKTASVMVTGGDDKRVRSSTSANARPAQRGPRPDFCTLVLVFRSTCGQWTDRT
eukprot:scaffold2534_cov364-Prasinococcus_capsulatus_cf.AAC.9